MPELLHSWRFSFHWRPKIIWSGCQSVLYAGKAVHICYYYVSQTLYVDKINYLWWHHMWNIYMEEMLSSPHWNSCTRVLFWVHLAPSLLTCTWKLADFQLEPVKEILKKELFHHPYGSFSLTGSSLKASSAFWKDYFIYSGIKCIYTF